MPGLPGAVIPVSASTYQVGKRVTVGILPATMLITPDGKTLYVGDWDSGTVTPIRAATSTAGKPIKTGAGSFAVTMAITPNGKTVYIDGDISATSGFIVPVSTATGAVGKAIIVPGSPDLMAITPNGKTLYVLSNGGFGPQDIIPVNTAINTAGPAIHTGLEPIAIAITSGHRQ
jgi:YVTN family beta-propeller protein